MTAGPAGAGPMPAAGPPAGRPVGASAAPRGLPLFRARNWAIGFLIFAIIIAAVLAETMPAFFRAAYHLG